MGIAGTNSERGGQFVLARFFVQVVLAGALSLVALPTPGHAQFFSNTPAAPLLRPPVDVPSAPPAAAPTPPSTAPNSAAPKGPMLQSLPPSGAQAHPGTTVATVPAVPAGQAALAVSARYGRDLPQISGGLHWRVYRTEQNGIPRIVKEDKGPAPTFVLPPGAYVISVGFGLANVTKAVQLRA